MRQFFNIFILLLVSNIIFAQAQRTFVKSFNLKGDSYVTLQFNGPTVVEKWDETYVRVLTNVTLDNANDAALRFFAQKGRYRLNMTNNSGATISSPIHTDQIKYQGETLHEIITYTVFVPKNVMITVNENGIESKREKSVDIQ